MSIRSRWFSTEPDRRPVKVEAGRPRRPTGRRAALGFAVACLLAGTSRGWAVGQGAVPLSSPGATVSLPNTPAGRQAGWFVGAVTHGPIPTAEITAHFDGAFLAQVPPAELNATLKGVIGVRIDSITTSAPDALVFIVTVNGTTKLRVSLAVDAGGLISGLLLQPAAPPTLPTVPSTWAAVDRQVRSVAPQVHFLVASVSGGTCRSINGIGSTTPAPLGSAFKLYVLDALARDIALGKVSWATKLTITSQVKSLPSGVLQDEPDGTRLSVQKVASDMISISDNTAANMLISLVGRGAVEAATRTSGMADPALDVPFLDTRELFVLKLDDWPKLAQRYLALGTAGRLAMLTGTVDHVPLSALASVWTTPRDVNSLEWFASPTDICHVYASLAALARQPRLSPVAGILGLNKGDMALPPSQWRSVWFKGGSEPGVLTLSYLATTREGRTYVVSALTENPTEAISETSAELELISAIKGAFELATR